MIYIISVRLSDQISHHSLDDVISRGHGILRLLNRDASLNVSFKLDTHFLFLMPEYTVPVVFDVVVCAS